MILEEHEQQAAVRAGERRGQPPERNTVDSRIWGNRLGVHLQLRPLPSVSVREACMLVK